MPERAARRRPAEIVGEAAGRGVPGRLVEAVGGDQVEGGAVAVGVVAGLAGGGHAQAVAARDPEHVVERRASISSELPEPASAHAGSGR